MAEQATITASGEITDLRAITEVIHGNREMFEVLVRRHNPLLYRLGMSYLRNHQQVEDAMQNAWLKCYLHLARFQRGSAFATWLGRIMINECLMGLRKQKAAREELREHGLSVDVPDEAARVGSALLNLKEMKTLLEKSISELSRRHRSVYLLREVQQLSVADTATMLKLTPENVKVTLHRAREQLKTRMLQSAAGIELFPYHAPFCNRLTARVMAAVLVTS